MALYQKREEMKNTKFNFKSNGGKSDTGDDSKNNQNE
jgi:hypothetical protein